LFSTLSKHEIYFLDNKNQLLGNQSTAELNEINQINS